MKRVPFFLVLLGPCLAILAADPKPPASTEIPASSRRPVVVTLSKEHAAQVNAQPPKADLPEGYRLEIAAAAPLVTHPIAGCVDDRGRLFVGDGVGVNWNKAQLEANPPNRVLMLEDTDQDGIFDKSTIFADRMTFPEGAQWLDGSLYVASPPGIWKLTDTDNDGVADRREMIVTGFDYTGNAADVHGPFLHPNGRLYWCHGRKGFKVADQDGRITHEGKSSGIWSCRPDGSDVQWHSLLCGDNPVEIDFTPEGEIIGVQNLYHSQPRGDTIVHWLYGGIYERPDQMQVIAGRPRTLEKMPVMYNFGHVAVSGSCFWRSHAGGAREPLHFMVTHFNTQRVVRMELTRDGATYQARENEFLKMHSPDIHFTDVMEDRDGSLLVIDTGGWFRIGCPSSLMAKPDVTGAIYRIKPVAKKNAALAAAWRSPAKSSWDERTEQEIISALNSDDPAELLRTLQNISIQADRGVQFSPGLSAKLHDSGAFWRHDQPVLDHAAVLAAAKLSAQPAHPREGWVTYQPAGASIMLRRTTLLQTTQVMMLEAREKGAVDDPARRARWKPIVDLAIRQIESRDAVAEESLIALQRAFGAVEIAHDAMIRWLASENIGAGKMSAIERLVTANLAVPAAQDLVTKMLGHSATAVRQSAIGLLAGQTASATNAAWLPPLEKMLAENATPVLLDAIRKLKAAQFDEKLQAIADDAKRPLPIRLKALDAMKGLKLTGETFSMVKGVLTDSGSSSAARIQAATMLVRVPAAKEQQLALAPLFASVGPVELKELLPAIRKNKDAEVARVFATELAKNPTIGGLQESAYRTAFADAPPDIFENIVRPAFLAASEISEAKKRALPTLADRAAAQGNADAGCKVFESGKGTCIACHQVGDKGRPIGPNLSTIGAIRTERDLLESILFPSNTLARDYEAHVIETSAGETIVGVIKSHTAEGLLVVDIAGQEKNVPHTDIAGNTMLAASLMPMGLDQTLSEQELLDLVAYLRSLK